MSKRAASFSRFKIKKWEPIHQAIVLGSISGASNKELAEKFNYTKEHISNILCTPQAEALREKIRQELAIKANPTEKLAHLKNKALDRMVSFVDNDTLASNAPMAYTDRAMKIYQIASGTDENGNQNKEKTINNTNIFANVKIVNELQEALSFSRQVNDLHRVKAGNE